MVSMFVESWMVSVCVNLMSMTSMCACVMLNVLDSNKGIESLFDDSLV